MSRIEVESILGQRRTLHIRLHEDVNRTAGTMQCLVSSAKGCRCLACGANTGAPGAVGYGVYCKLCRRLLAVPIQAPLGLLGAARRVPLSQDAAAMSLGHFLEVSFGARHLSIGPRPLHAGYARYFGRGSAVACFLWERVGPAQVDMPPQLMHYYVPAQQGWIKDEVEELINVSLPCPSSPLVYSLGKFIRTTFLAVQVPCCALPSITCAPRPDQ